MSEGRQNTGLEPVASGWSSPSVGTSSAAAPPGGGSLASTISPGQTVARLARPGEKEILIAVPEAQRDLVEGGRDLVVTLNALPGR